MPNSSDSDKILTETYFLKSEHLETLGYFITIAVWSLL